MSDKVRSFVEAAMHPPALQHVHPFSRALIWLALAIPVTRVTLWFLDLAVRNLRTSVRQREM